MFQQTFIAYTGKWIHNHEFLIKNTFKYEAWTYGHGCKQIVKNVKQMEKKIIE